jgi:hypothetical protein
MGHIVNTFPKNETKTVYVTFCVDEEQRAEFKKLQFQLHDYEGHTQTIIVNHEDLKPEQMLWDDRIWQKVK